MSHLLADDALLDDMAAAVFAIRSYFMQLAEQHPEMDTAGLDDLLRRYRDETGHEPPRSDRGT
jgi:hypothetical protein